jgi:hypothetical protein
VISLDGDGNKVDILESCTDPDNPYGHAENLRTARVFYPSGTDQVESARIKRIEYPDGGIEYYTYEFGIRAGDRLGPV